MTSCHFPATFLVNLLIASPLHSQRRRWLHLIARKYRDITRCVRNRGALIDQIQQARETLEKLLTLLQSTPVARDRFVSHLY
jgi:hypothetical protein